MAVMIRGMENIPGSCFDCDLHNYHFCDLTGNCIEQNYDDSTRAEDCPLEEVPEPYIVEEQQGEKKMSMTQQELMNECDMLQGNINRMMVTDDHEELLTMFAYAHKRLGEIYWENKKRINLKALEKQ